MTVHETMPRTAALAWGVLFLLAGPAAAPGEPPVACEFRVASVTPPAARSAVVHRLRSLLDPDLQGRGDCPGKLLLTARYERGRLRGQVEWLCGKTDRTVLATRDLQRLDELAALANQVVRARKVWMARLVSPVPGTQDRLWQARGLLASSSPTPRLRAPDEASYWEITKPPGGDGLFTVRKERGSARVGGLLVPLRQLAKAEIVLTVINTDTPPVPLKDMQVYVKAGAFPDEHPLRMRKEKMIGVTDANGTVRFEWRSSDPAYLLIARNLVPLVRFVVAPTRGVWREKVAISPLWYLEKAGGMVSLDEFVIQRRIQIDENERRHQLQMKVLAQAKALLAQNKLTEAETVITQLPASDPYRKEIQGLIGLAKAKGEVDMLCHKASMAEADGDYAKAIRWIEKALAAAPAADKPNLTLRLQSLKTQAETLQKKIAPALARLNGLQWKTAKALLKEIGQIELAVDAICRAGQVAALLTADKELGSAQGVLNKAILTFTAEIKAGTRKQADPLIVEVGKVGKRLEDCRERISVTLQRLRKPAKAAP